MRRAVIKHTAVIEESDKGFAVSVSHLPGYHSQGDTKPEAFANIAEAIREYRAVIQEFAQSAGAKTDEIEV